MKLPGPTGAHLTYCTNIHPGESWADVRTNLERFVLPVRARVCPGKRFGVGLRLSARAASELDVPEALAELESFLAANDLYVFTINGFPYGDFHRTCIKENVFRPDWREQARLDYSNRLARLLAHLLPAEDGLYGSVSTVPIGFGAHLSRSTDFERAIDRLVAHTAVLMALAETTGKTIVLALEPEPHACLETSEDAARFFDERLFTEEVAGRLAKATGTTRRHALEALHEHVGVCFDACHAAVEFEQPEQAIARLRGAGVRIAKVQLSAGLRVATIDATALGELKSFAEGVYLHQAVARTIEGLERFLDLPPAIERIATSGRAKELRVHFHVPLFQETLGRFDNTQAFLRNLLSLHRREAVSAHLEIETYSWEVLPDEFRSDDIVVAVAREIDWVLAELER